MSVRMQDVALRAGVSAQTVSRVLRQSPRVAPATAARVRAAMRELGYHGNEAAGALKRGQTRTLGLLLPFLGMPFWAEVASGAEEMAYTHGYSLLLCNSSGSLQKEADNLALLLSHRVAGILYATPRCRPQQHPECESLLASGIPVALISADPNDLPYCHVYTDDWRAGYVAVRHLLDLGRGRIALVWATDADGIERTPVDEAAIHKRLAGARRALEEVGLAAAMTAVYAAPCTIEGGYAVGAALVEAERPLPDALFVTNDIVAAGILEVFRAAGVSVPDQCAIIAHDGLYPAPNGRMPALSTIAPPSKDMGRACIDLLLRAQRGEPLPATYPFEAELIVGTSTIGPGANLERRLGTPISDPQAWSRWREPPEDAGVPSAAAPVLRRTLGEWLARKEVSVSSLPATTPAADAVGLAGAASPI